MLALPGCDASSRGEVGASNREAVVNGRPSLSGTPEDAVVLLRTELDDIELTCSATLVAPNLLITARHCVSYSTEGSFLCSVRGELIDDGSNAGRVGLHLPADAIEVHTGDGAERRLIARGAHVLSTVADTVCVDDLAFVVLDRELDLPVMPMRLERSTVAGEGVSLTGYGLDENMEFGTPFSALTRKTRDDLAVADVGPLLVEDVTTAPPRTVMLVGPAGCVGDSGGPLYATASGAIVGVYSLLVGGSCVSESSWGHYAHVPAYLVLIDDAFRAAGATPVPEGEPQDGGTADAGAATGGASSGEAGTGGSSGGADTGDGAGSGTGGGSGEGGETTQPGAGGVESAGTAGTGGTRQNDSGCSFTPRARSTDSVAWLGMLAAFGAVSGLFCQRRPSSG